MASFSGNSLLLRLAIIGLLVLLLLVPLGQLRDLIEERAAMRDAARQSVAALFGAAQVIGGPILSVPIDVTVRRANETRTERHWQRLLAERLVIDGEIVPATRYRGIHAITVYESRLALRATFSSARIAALAARWPGERIRWDEARLIVPVADPRGIREIRRADWNGDRLRLLPEAYAELPAVGAPIGLRADAAGGEQRLEIDLTIAGTGRLQLMPMAAVTEAALRSSWPHPSFEGAFAAIEPRISAAGFTARWQVLEINRPVPQQWADQAVGAEALRASAFGVSLYRPVDAYQRNYRAIRYAALFIALTFMGFFVWEHTAGSRHAAARLHPLHYLLVGLALATFYLLLMALSEHLHFALAYALAAGALVAVLAVYLAGALQSVRSGLAAAGSIAAIYGALYLLVLSEDYALLLGALLLFAALTIVMLATRRVDWNALGARPGSRP